MAYYTEDHLRVLQEALASGISEVSYEGKVVKYRSMSELEAAINRIQSHLAGRQVPRTIRFKTKRGLS